MKTRYANYGEFVREQNALRAGAVMRIVGRWSDLKSWRSATGQAGGGSINRGYVPGSGRSAAPNTGPAPGPTPNLGLNLTGDRVKRKFAENLNSITDAFDAKSQKAGRAGAVMTVYESSGGKYPIEYYFVLVTSDSSMPGARDPGWTPDGNHEAIVWSWPANEGGAAVKDYRGIFDV